jgi:hypothetical protein
MIDAKVALTATWSGWICRVPGVHSGHRDARRVQLSHVKSVATPIGAEIVPSRSARA